MTNRDIIESIVKKFQGAYLGADKARDLTEEIVEALDMDIRKEYQSRETTVERVTGKNKDCSAFVAKPPEEKPKKAKGKSEKQKPATKLITEAVVSWPDAPYDPNKEPHEQEDSSALKVQRRVPND